MYSKPRFSKKFQWELARFATSAAVTGGASRLFKFFVNTFRPRSVVSYCDHSWGSGKVYEIMGFQHQSTQVGYWYTDYKQRHNRMKFRKSQIKDQVPAGDTMTEWQIVQQLGYDRIWDCGQSTWSWINNSREQL